MDSIVIEIMDNLSVLNRRRDADSIRDIVEMVKDELADPDKWNANMFLNDFDKRDKNAGINVKLSEVYLDELFSHVYMDA